LELGIAYYRSGDWPLAEMVGAKWASMQYDASADLTDTLTAAEDALGHGLRVVFDVRTGIAEYATMLNRDDLDAALECRSWYAQQCCEAARVAGGPIEVWANAELINTLGSLGPAVEYPGLLEQVAEELRASEKSCEVWTGGFGLNCDGDFLYSGLKKCPGSFDRLNMHPFCTPRGGTNPDGSWRGGTGCATEWYGNSLRNIREFLSNSCKGQPIVASAFGIASVDLPTPPEGKFWRVPGRTKAVRDVEAAEWYGDLLATMAAGGVEVCCLLARDRVSRRHFADYAGIADADGVPKPFLKDLVKML